MTSFVFVKILHFCKVWAPGYLTSSHHVPPVEGHIHVSLVPSPTIEAKDRLQYLAETHFSWRDTVSDP